MRKENDSNIIENAKSYEETIIKRYGRLTESSKKYIDLYDEAQKLYHEVNSTKKNQSKIDLINEKTNYSNVAKDIVSQFYVQMFGVFSTKEEMNSYRNWKEFAVIGKLILKNIPLR